MIRITDKKLLGDSQITPDGRVQMISELAYFHRLDPNENEPTFQEFKEANQWLFDSDYFIKRQDIKTLRSIMFPNIKT